MQLHEGQFRHAQAAARLLHRCLVVEQEVATAALQHFQGRGVGAGAVQLDRQGRIVDQRVGRLPIGVATDQDHSATLQVFGNPRQQGIAAEIQVEDDFPHLRAGFQGVCGQLRFAGGAGPDLHAAVLQAAIQPCAGIGAQLCLVAGVLQQALAQLEDRALRAAFAVAVGIGWKLVKADLNQRLRPAGGSSMAWAA
ncbi:hypothetical protein D9M68_604400 [compost metagenome]